jgi:ABC-type transport system involved in multi-copper enzyme maturation permease subunit
VNGRHILLIAKYSARYSVRGGIGLVFLLLSLTFGLMVAHMMLQPVEIGANEIAKHSRSGDKQEATQEALDIITRQAKPVVAWMLKPSSAEPDRAADRAADEWTDFLLDERPSLLSAIFLILLFGWPLVVAFGAFDLYSGDIGSRQLRYQLLRVDRGSIYFGRLLGMLVTFVLVLLLLGTTVTAYMGLKLSYYSWPALLGWGAYGTVALVVVSVPYIALCAWVSTAFGSSFASLTIASLVIGGVPLFAMLGRVTHEYASYANYALPWGFQMRLFHHEPAQVALAVGGCALQTALFTWLGYRKFTRRDL